MTYTEALAVIHSLDRFGSRPGLDRVRQLFDRVPGLLDQRFIHIAGTNGKGSVSAMLSAILTAAGHTTGLFISPYITEFCERIQINGVPVSRQELADAVAFFCPILHSLNDQGIIITEFEFITAVAFYLFRQHGCDIIVCEVGMGGLLDSTNLIQCPLCAVITRIDLDHTAILGDTVDAIAYQKCGIIKEDSVTVTARQRDDAMAVIEASAGAKHTPLYRAEDIRLDQVEHTLSGTRFTYHGERMTLPLLGTYQDDNLRCALAVYEVLRAPLSLCVDHLRQGLSNVRHPARFELLSREPYIVLDGAHNPGGLLAFASSVKTYFGDRRRTLIIGMLADKDIDVELLDKLFTRVIATDVDNPRALPAEDLAERLRCCYPDVEVIHSPRQALDRAKRYGDDIFICGSLYLAGEIRPYLL